jgi:hypothetical protein
VVVSTFLISNHFFADILMLIIGSLFSLKVDDFDRYGWPIKDCLIPDAELRFVDEDAYEDLQGTFSVLLLINFLSLDSLLSSEFVITSEMVKAIRNSTILHLPMP